jgi:hypothetical protein
VQCHFAELVKAAVELEAQGCIAFLRGICCIQTLVFLFVAPNSSGFAARIVGIDMLFMFEKEMPTTLTESPCENNFVFMAMSDDIYLEPCPSSHSYISL